MLILAKFAKDKPAVLGAIIVLAVAVIAVLAPLLAPYPGDVSAAHLLRRLKPPSWEHPFGTDNLGRDIFSRVILGTRGALMIALMVVGISMAIGVPPASSPATAEAGCRRRSCASPTSSSPCRS
jgi:peptide/nickel transport system permease protein